jgi:hypothetical protein
MNTPLGFKAPNDILGLPTVSASGLHPFGCLAWYKVLEANCKKLDPKARQCLLLYSYLPNGNGFCLWDLGRRTVVKSRDVIFDHRTFLYGAQLATPSGPSMVKLPWPLSTARPVVQHQPLDTNPAAQSKDPCPSLFEQDDALPVPLCFNLSSIVDR